MNAIIMPPLYQMAFPVGFLLPLNTDCTCAEVFICFVFN